MGHNTVVEGLAVSECRPAFPPGSGVQPECLGLTTIGLFAIGEGSGRTEGSKYARRRGQVVVAEGVRICACDGEGGEGFDDSSGLGSRVGYWGASGQKES